MTASLDITMDALDHDPGPHVAVLRTEHDVGLADVEQPVAEGFAPEGRGCLRIDRIEGHLDRHPRHLPFSWRDQCPEGFSQPSMTGA